MAVDIWGDIWDTVWGGVWGEALVPTEITGLAFNDPANSQYVSVITGVIA